MATKIFINLPVKDLNRSIEFFTRLGFTFNPQFTDETATCMIIGENIYAMLLVESRYRDFTKKAIADATKTSEMLICIDAESRKKVDEMVTNAINAGGTAPNEKQDHGWMYSHGFDDLDGHTWEVMWMDPNGYPKEPNA